MTDPIKLNDFVTCDCPIGKYCIHCTEEQKNKILENQKKAEIFDCIIPFLQKELTTQQLKMLKIISDKPSMKILGCLYADKKGENT